MGSNSNSERSLRLRAVLGVSWAEFNSTQFKEGRLLKIGSCTAVKPLVQAIQAETNRHGSVSVHAPAEDPAALAVALKAFATAPLDVGTSRLVITPSLGRARFAPGANVEIQS